MSVFKKPTYIISMVILCSLFFIFGFVSWVNAILIPYFKIACELTHTQAYFVAFAFYIAYFVMAIPASKLLNRFGFKKGMLIGLAMMSLGTLIFVPAAYTRTYGIFLFGLFCIGTGLAILQTAANPYVTIIGPIESAAKRISIVGLCNKFAGIISPLIFAAVILQASDGEMFQQLKDGVIMGAERELVLDELIQRVMVPYAFLSALLLIFGFLIRYSPLPEINTREQNKSADASSNERSSIFQYPYLILGVLAIFFHVGAQVISIDTIINYAGTMGIELTAAKVFPSYTMSCTLVGYFIGIVLIPKILSQKRALQIATSLGLILSIGVIYISGNIELFSHKTDISIWFLVLMGMPNALIYAGIWPLAIRNLGKFTNLGSSLLVMALCGNAFLPVIYGSFADSYGERLSYWVLVPCFLYLIFYAFKGHKIEHWKKSPAL
ncbi:MAG: glucose/galactose MFS transporter [Bacteroidetes bacterium RIFOXYA12_FULL_40_10]|jgi:glucose/galactose transporter|nr:MAG: glucose/galactose MFS transporter [Bacteroidetes bacterium GWE2_40_15]OFY88383.1 MAG: glucose/galactose MFS transporter [Bacteroidetes bacterium RIFOXYA12_FULL_40_10]PKP07475.1 MAG: glucose/galactose MFS transporter [Bacteroidetes bacterium HGW-Bacteroidetes-5]HBZ24771.1 glucose/galactose MFS transporter [Rikenellaceae bacterium]